MEKNNKIITYKTLFTTSNELWAVTIQDDLKKAGFTLLVRDGGENQYNVVAAQGDYEHVKALLETNPKYGQIFSVPKE